MPNLMRSILFMGVFLIGGVAAAQTATQPAKAVVSVSSEVEEGKKVLLATVKLNGKPVEGAKVDFFVRRTFGNLLVGQETTLDDGSAAVPFPQGLPGGETGQLEVLAIVTSPPQYASAQAQTTLDGGVVVRPEPDPFPRALWAPHAPAVLIIIVALLLGGVWCTYLYVLSQLLKILKGFAHESKSIHAS
jgi:hypothetical protein